MDFWNENEVNNAIILFCYYCENATPVLSVRANLKGTIILPCVHNLKDKLLTDVIAIFISVEMIVPASFQCMLETKQSVSLTPHKYFKWPCPPL